ncbi:structural maintenance of chromosome 4 [Pseudoscourfieldia marina]
MVAELAKRISDIEGATVLTAADEKRLKELEKAIFAVDEGVRAIEVSCEHLTRKVEELQERIDNCGGPKHRALRKEEGELTARIEAAKSELASQKAAMATADKTVARLDAEMKKSEKQVAKIVGDRESREKAFAKLAESLQGVRDEYAEAQSALEEAESRMAELSETYAKYESALNKFRSMEIEMESEQVFQKR